MQEPFLRAIHNRDALIERCKLLIHAADVLSLPVISTTQYHEKMGPIVPEIASILPTTSAGPFDKLVFSCAADTKFTNALQEIDRNQVLLCGVETHICVAQTALDLAHIDYNVQCPADAVSSRTAENHALGLSKMRDNDILISSTEGAIMEIVYKAGTPEFKAILKLIK